MLHLRKEQLLYLSHHVVNAWYLQHTPCGQKLVNFMKLVVQVYLDTTDVQHEKLALRLVDPNILGFSVPCTPDVESEKIDRKREGDKITANCKKLKWHVVKHLRTCENDANI